MNYWEKVNIFYKYETQNNSDFINLFFDNQNNIKKNTTNKLINDIICNNDLKLSQDYNELILKLSTNTLITTRLGCVESKFLITYFFNKNFIDHNIIKSANDIDFYMKKNAGFYYTNEEEKKYICDWWCNNTIDIIKKSILTSCICFLHYDLCLWALMDLKKEYYNWGILHKLILQNSQNKKILYIGNGTISIKYAFDNGLQNKWNFKVSNFTMEYYKTPQTTLNMNYPDKSIKETTEKIIEDIVNNYSDFDTAILGCGAYGPPIMNLLSEKLQNKNLIYLGSDCYKMFGLYSKGMPIPTWDKDAIAENWIEIIEECDSKCKEIDGGKYWKT